MDQVFRNLVSNAIKFSPEGGIIGIRAFFQKDDTEPNPSIPSLSQMDSSHEQSHHHGILPRFLHGATNIHHSHPGLENAVFGVNVGVTLTPRSGQRNIKAHGNLIIIVTDSGPGISEENQKKLFRSVVQFDPEKNQGGGIGTHPFGFL